MGGMLLTHPTTSAKFWLDVHFKAALFADIVKLKQQVVWISQAVEHVNRTNREQTCKQQSTE